jgi:hypothetical protein
MSQVNSYKVYNIIFKENDGFVASFGRQQRCHEFMKMMKEQHFFDTGSMDDAEEEYGENSYYIEYGFALTQTSVASWGVKFSEWK